MSVVSLPQKVASSWSSASICEQKEWVSTQQGSGLAPWALLSTRIVQEFNTSLGCSPVLVTSEFSLYGAVSVCKLGEPTVLFWERSGWAWSHVLHVLTTQVSAQPSLSPARAQQCLHGAGCLSGSL